MKKNIVTIKFLSIFLSLTLIGLWTLTVSASEILGTLSTGGSTQNQTTTQNTEAGVNTVNTVNTDTSLTAEVVQPGENQIVLNNTENKPNTLNSTLQKITGQDSVSMTDGILLGVLVLALAGLLIFIILSILKRRSDLNSN